MKRFLQENGFAVFHGLPRGADQISAVYWDTEAHPDYRDFLASALAAGVRLVTMYANEFSEDSVDDALERLEESSLPREESRSIESRLRELRPYAGFICQ